MSHLRPTAIRHHLRASALLLALVPAAATLTSCGFDYPTDRVNTIGSGDNNRDHSVDALGIRVLATAKGEGRLIGALANNLTERATLDSVAAPEGQIEVGEFEPVVVEGRAGVNLTSQAPIELTGDFTAGDVVPLDLTFSTGETASLDVPVVKACFQYTEIPSPSASASTEGEEGEAAGAAAEEEGAEVDATSTEGEGAEETEGVESGAEESGHEEDGGDATFDCADEAPSPEGGEH